MSTYLYGLNRILALHHSHGIPIKEIERALILIPDESSERDNRVDLLRDIADVYEDRTVRFDIFVSMWLQTRQQS